MTAIILTICAVAIGLVVSGMVLAFRLGSLFMEIDDPMQTAFGDIPTQTESGSGAGYSGARGQRLQQSIHPVVQPTSRFGRKHP